MTAASATTTRTAAPKLRYETGSFVAPGDRLATIRQVQPGAGTHVKAGHVYASLVGQLQVVTSENSDETIFYATVVHSKQNLPSSLVLKIGQAVLARVVRISSMQAYLEIVATTTATTTDDNNNNPAIVPLQHTFEGAIRREDVCTGALSEAVCISDSFVPGDLVACRILSLSNSGDARRYLLTTAAPELGVIFAMSATSGKPMVPSSWKEMECPVTGAKEPRKCARPQVMIATDTTVNFQ
jgi:exosome complex component CSL4